MWFTFKREAVVMVVFMCTPILLILMAMLLPFFQR